MFTALFRRVRTAPPANRVPVDTLPVGLLVSTDAMIKRHTATRMGDR